MTRLVDITGHVTATTGTGGPIVLGAAIDTPAHGKFRSFADAGIADGEQVSYVIDDIASGHRETCKGIFTSATSELTRNTLASTNSGSPINLSGSAQIRVTALGEELNAIGSKRDVPGTTDTLTAVDAETGAYIRTTGASDSVVTVPHGVYKVLQISTVSQQGAGVPSFAEGTNVILNGPVKCGGQNKAMQVVCVETGATDVFDVIGGVA